MWLGESDPLGSMGDMRALDPTLEELQRIHDVLRKYFTETFTVADCSRLAEERDGWQYRREDLRQLMTFRDKINLKSFGRMLARHRDRIGRDGWCLKSMPSTTASNAYQMVAPAAAPVAAAPTTDVEIPF